MKKTLPIILLLIVCISIAGCGESQTQGESQAQKEKRLVTEATQEIETAFSHLENSELEKFYGYTEPDKFKSLVNLYFKDYLEVYEYNELMEEWLPKVNCRLDSVNYVDDNTINATVIITAPDQYAGIHYKYAEMKRILESILSSVRTRESNFSFEEDSYLKDSFKVIIDSVPVDTSVDIVMKKSDSKWNFSMSDQLGNAICGDILGATQRIDDEFESIGTSREEMDKEFERCMEDTVMILRGIY